MADKSSVKSLYFYYLKSFFSLKFLKNLAELLADSIKGLRESFENLFALLLGIVFFISFPLSSLFMAYYDIRMAKKLEEAKQRTLDLYFKNANVVPKDNSVSGGEDGNND